MSKVYGLVGYPLKHSLSYIMHNAVFKRLGLDCEYRNFEIGPEKDFKKEIKRLIPEEKVSGFNVTIPYKEDILKLVEKDKLVGAVGEIMAANTVRVDDNGNLRLDNTDYQGFLISLKEKFKYSLESKKVALLGAGGAGKAVFAAVHYDIHKYGKVDSIKVYDKDRKKADDLVFFRDRNLPFSCKIADSIEELNIEKADMLINATPVGMKEDECLVNPNILDNAKKNLFVYDIIYNPAETKLIKEAKKRNLEAHNGLWMLILQGYRSLEIWLGDIITSNKDLVLRTMEDALRREGFTAC